MKVLQIEDMFFQEQERLLLWVPVFFSFGIGWYFSLAMEPALSLALYGCLGLIILTGLVWRVFLLRLLFIAVTLMAAGFATGGLKSWHLATPVLEKPLSPRMIIGTVEKVSQYRSGKMHVVIRQPEIKRGPTLDKLRIKVNKYDAVPTPGDRIRIKAGLLPPPPPTMPGDFDYARQIWFQGIGAVGYGVTSPEIMEKAPARLISMRGIRQAMARNIRRSLPGDVGGLAAALITGQRDGISNEVADNMRNSGLAHLLAISGLHMGLLCGAAFFFARFLLTRSEYLTLRYPVKKIAAMIAIGAGLVYVTLSGGGIPTVRAFIMAAILFLGIVTDRRAISLRLVAIAAMVILVMSPEALLSVSFQMSFAAVVALVVAYENLGGSLTIHKNQGWGHKLMLYVAASLFTTLVAEMAIAPFALFHFNKLVQYGLLANLLAMPIMAFWVMPWVVAYLLLAPFGLGEIALYPMSYGLEAIMGIAGYVSHAPGSYRLVPSMALGPVVVIALGALWFGIWRLRWRYFGLLGVALGVTASFFTPQPDILIDNKGKLIGVRNAAEDLELSSLRAGRMVRERWAQRAGQEDAGKWQYEDTAYPEDKWLACDRLSCLYRPDHKSRDTLIALVKDERALSEDCRNAQVVISLVPVNIYCPSAKLVIDRWDFYHKGGHALWLPEKSGDWITVKTVAGVRGDRPWSRRK